MRLGNESGYVDHDLRSVCGHTKMAVKLARTNGYMNRICHIHKMLTIPMWLSWLRQYVNSNFRNPTNTDIPSVVVLGQRVRELDFSRAEKR